MAERTIKVAVRPVARAVLLCGSVSLLCSIMFWQHIPLSTPVTMLSVAVSTIMLLVLLQLRFLPQMTVGIWTPLWGVSSPLFFGSLFTLPALPFVPLLALVGILTVSIGIWAAYRFYPFASDTRLHKARFARLDEMETLLSRHPCNDGLVVGQVKQFFFIRHFVCVRPTRMKKEIGNSLIIAPTGGGKGNMIEGQILAWKESIIINDPKGDLFIKTAGEKAKRGPVYVLDPTRGVGHCYDPLHGKMEEGEYLTVARNLVFDPQDRDPFFAESASLMMMQLFQAARRENIAPLVYLRHIVGLGLPMVAKRLNSIDPKLATAFLGAEFADANLDNRTLTSVWSTLQTRLTPLLTERLVRCFTRSDVTAETIMHSERPVTVYFRLEEAHLERLSPFVRIMVESLVKELIACYDRTQGKGCRKVLLSLDELGITPIPNLTKFAATGRSRNIIFQLFYQSPAQLADNYGKDKAQSIMSNMDTTVFLRPNDQETARSIEDLLGRGSQFSESKNFREGNEFSEGLSEQAIPVMTAREIMEMNDTYALLFHRNFPPMKVHRLKWWHSDMLSKQHSLPVPVLEALPDIPTLPEIGLKAASSSPIRFVDPDEIVAKQREKKAGSERRR